MDNKTLDRKLSAIVLVVYAVVWIMYFIFANYDFMNNENFSLFMNIITALMQVFVYIVLFYNAWQVNGGMIYKILIAGVTLWLIFCVVARFIPSLNIDHLAVFSII